MEGAYHHLLAVVVVDLHAVEGLEILEVVCQEHDKVAFEPCGKSLGVLHFASLVREGLAPKRCLAVEGLEAGKDLLPSVHFQLFIRALAIHQGGCVKRQVRQALPRKVVFHSRYEAVQFVVLRGPAKAMLAVRLAAIRARGHYDAMLRFWQKGL